MLPCVKTKVTRYRKQTYFSSKTETTTKTYRLDLLTACSSYLNQTRLLVATAQKQECHILISLTNQPDFQPGLSNRPSTSSEVDQLGGSAASDLRTVSLTGGTQHAPPGPPSRRAASPSTQRTVARRDRYPVLG